MSYSYDIIIQIITSSGTIVALVALGYQIFRDRKEKKWEQAYRVCCWLDSTKYLRKQIKNPDYLALVVISNESKQPIYDAKVFMISRSAAPMQQLVLEMHAVIIGLETQ